MSLEQDEDEGRGAPLSFRERRRLAASALSSSACPFLSTVDRRHCDFDKAPVCSVTLSSHNVYACLVCGLFFGGRGPATPAHVHSVEAGHHVWVGLTPPEGVTEGVGEGSWRPRFWCLPDGYEVVDASLEDIGVAIRPRFAAAQLAALDASATMAMDACETPFLPGYLGANNLGHTDGMLALVQALAHVTPLRDYFLTEPPPYSHARSPLVHRFGELLRRLWSSGAMRATVSPHAFVNAVSDASNRRFYPGQPIDVSEFLPWLLNALHRGLVEVGATLPADGPGAPAPAAGAKRQRPTTTTTSSGVGGKVQEAAAGAESIISHVFAGEVEVTLLSSQLEDAKRREAEAKAKAKGKRRRNVDETQGRGGEGDDDDDDDSDDGGGGGSGGGGDSGDKPADGDGAGGAGRGREEGKGSSQPALPKVSRLPFLFLTLDLPPVPLFTDERGGVKIPQVPVYELLARFDGVAVTETLQGQYWEKKRFRIVRLPRLLALVFKRFSRNAFFAEKNATIVTCPTRSLDLGGLVHPSALHSARGAASAALEAARRAGAPGPAAAGAAGAAVAPPALPRPEAIPLMPVASLKALLGSLNAHPSAAEASGMERGELVRLACAAVAAAGAAGGGGGGAGGAGGLAAAGAPPAAAPPALPPPLAAFSAVTRFDLVASVVHEVASNTESGGPGMGGGGAGKGKAARAWAGGGAAAASYVAGVGGGGSAAAASASSSSSSSASAGAGTLLSSAAAAVRSTASANDPLWRGAYKVHLLGPRAGMGQQQQKWYEISDLSVTEILAQQVGVSESCLLFYKRREELEEALQSLKL
jgi:hypothetical protein